LQRTLDALSHDSRTNTIALVQSETEAWWGASAYAQESPPPNPGDRFGIASTTKAFVATVVLQLAGERRLSLDDPVALQLPDRLRSGRRITIRELLNHTSGLPPDVSFELPRQAEQPPVLFPPGTGYSYSNLNYVVLGLIVEKVTGRPLDEVVGDRIIHPLDLVDTSYGTVRPQVRGSVPNWLGVVQQEGGEVSGAGGVVSTAGDLARFFQALLGGKLLRPPLLAEMTKTVKTGTEFEAGLGLFRVELPCGSAWGHGGDELAYANQVLVSPGGSKIVVVAQSTLGWNRVKDAAEAMYCS
jgi:D-alanyl-D-alanine carboxypeptidase